MRPTRPGARFSRNNRYAKPAAAVIALRAVAAPNLAVYLLGHVGLLWLIRSAYFYSGLLPAVADLLLSGFSIAVGIWAASRSGSLGLSVWTFFLVQSLFVFIPRTVSKPETVGRRRSGQDPFDKARRSAEAALRRLATSDRQL